MKKQKLQWYGNPFAGWLLLLLSTIPFILGYSYIRDGLSSYFWTETQGKLSSLKAYKGISGKGRQYKIHALYTYTWNGKSLASAMTTIQGDYKSPFQSNRDSYLEASQKIRF